MNALEWIQTLLISGLCIPSFCADHRQAIVVEDPKSWFEAQRYCRQRCRDLVTVDDMGAMESLIRLIADKEDNEWWIGLFYDGAEEWHWSLPDKDFYQEGERNYRSFEGNDDGRFVSQVAGNWKTWSEVSKWFMCFDGSKRDGDRYVLVKEVFSWTGAVQYCRRHHTDLVSIRNANEKQAAQKVILKWDILIGLFKDGWHWSDKRYSSFRHWIEDSFIPKFSKSCAVMMRDISGKWKQQPCGESHPFVCGPVVDNCVLKRVLKLKVRSEDIQDLNDPAIEASILKQIKQMMQKSTQSNITMHWTANSAGQVFTKEQCLKEDCNS